MTWDSSNAGEWVGIVQRICSDTRYAGKKLVCSINLETDTACCAIIVFGDNLCATYNIAAESGVTKTVSFIVTAPSDSTLLEFQVTNAGLEHPGGNIKINWVKIEEGLCATAYVVPDPAIELLRCRQYFMRYNTRYGWFGTGFTSTANVARLSQTLPAPLRSSVVTPTVNVVGELHLITPSHVGETAYALSGLTNQPIVQNNNLCVEFKIINGASTVEPCYGQLRDEGSYVDISAELL